MQPRIWTFEKVRETAERCRTWQDFQQGFPTQYKVASVNGWLGALQRCCRMRKVNFNVIDDPAPEVLSLREVMEDDGCLLTQALDDPRWPVETSAPPLREEIM